MEGYALTKHSVFSRTTIMSTLEGLSGLSDTCAIEGKLFDTMDQR